MSLITHYACDNQDNDDNTLHDISGHGNNHDIDLVAIPGGVGFNHNRIECQGNIIDSDIAANSADMYLQGDMTVMAWIEMFGIPGKGGSNNPQFVIGFGAQGGDQEDNAQWSLTLSGSGQFGMWWEYGVGLNVNVYCNAGSLEVDANGFNGQTHFAHVACIRDLEEGTINVDYMLNGSLLIGESDSGLTPPDGGDVGGIGVRVFRRPTAVTGSLYGAVADIRVYDEVLDPSAVMAIFDAEKVLHLNTDRSGVVLDASGRLTNGGIAGSSYSPIQTGTELAALQGAEVAGWDSVRP
jgi:hypothetical protein